MKGKIAQLREQLANVEPQIVQAVDKTYDLCAVHKEAILAGAAHYHRTFESWDSYRCDAPLNIMDEMALGYIKNCKVKVSGIGVACGLGGIVTIVPDTIQFLTFTLRMVTGIAASYGFDPAPETLEGRVKIIVLQAYLNGNVGRSAAEGVERLGIGAATKYLKTVPMRSSFLMRLIVAIGKRFGVRVTRSMLLKGVPVVAAGISGALNWQLAQKIGERASKEFRTFREDIRQGKYAGDADYVGF